MPFTFQLKVAADSATPALAKLIKVTEGGRLAAASRGPLLALVRDHYRALPPNKMGAPSTGYWRSAADSTYAIIRGESLTITTDKIGVRQHLYGGPIYPINARFLSIPACVETHGKLPRDFSNLVIARLGRGQGAPIALVKASDADFVRNAPDKETASTKAMFWLARGVRQQPEPETIPTNAEFTAVFNKVLNDLVPK